MDEEINENNMDPLIAQVSTIIETLNWDHNPPKENVEWLIKNYMSLIAKGYSVILREAQKHGGTWPERLRVSPVILKALTDPEAAATLSNQRQLPQTLLGFTPEAILDMYHIGECVLANKEYDEASTVFLFITFLNPTISWVWLELGRAWEGLGHHPDALGAFGMAIQLDPYQLEAYEVAVEFCYGQREYDQAIALLEFGQQAIAAAPSDIDRTTLSENIQKLLTHAKAKTTRR